MNMFWHLARIVTSVVLIAFAVLSPSNVWAQSCGTWLSGPSSSDLPAGSTVEKFAASGGNHYALVVDEAGVRSVYRLLGGEWSQLPLDPSLGVPELLAAEGGVPTVLTSKVISETGEPPDRIYEYAVRTFDGDQWNQVATTEMFVGRRDVKEFSDMVHFNGSWYVASRYLDNDVSFVHGRGILYRAHDGALTSFASTQSDTCFADVDPCDLIPFPSFNDLQVVGNSLYVGGRFNFIRFDGATFVSASNLARISGESIIPMPTSPDGPVTGMFLESTSSSNPGLVVWGNFTQIGGVTHNRIARWNTFTSTWSTLGSGLAQVPVKVVQITGQTFNDIDYVAVGVSQAGGVAVNGLARWTGSAWENYGGTGSNTLQGTYATAINHGGVIVGGHGLSVNGVARNGAARWNGSTWVRLAQPGTGTDGIGRVVAMHNGQRYVGGDFTSIDRIPANRIAQRDLENDSWLPLGQGMNGPVRTMLSFNGELIAGGSFSSAGGVSASNVAAWNGSTWRALGSGIDDSVYALVVWNGNLIACGTFGGSGGVDASNVARWTGTSWEPIDAGFSTSNVLSATVFGGTLYLGGESSLWRVNGGSIESMGGNINGEIRALSTFQGSLYAGGTFTRVGSPGQNFRRIARFDGTQWFPVGPNAAGDFGTGSVESISSTADTMLVTGQFDVATSSGPASNVALFDGASWSDVPSGSADAMVRSGIVTDTGVAVAGDFQRIGGAYATSYAEWSASPIFLVNPTDTEVCEGVESSVTFEAIAATAASPQYRWRRNGVELSDSVRVSGAGTSTFTIDAVTPDDAGVYDCIITNCASVASAPATLTVRDASDSVCFGCPACPADFDQDGGVTGSDISAFFMEYEQGNPCADTDGDGGVTGADIAAFFMSYEAGGC